jgi:hypothetical protein
MGTQVFQRESCVVIAGLPSMDAASTDFFQTETLGAADVDLQGMQTEADVLPAAGESQALPLHCGCAAGSARAALRRAAFCRSRSRLTAGAPLRCAELQDSGEEGSPLGSDMDEGEAKPAARQLRWGRSSREHR